LKRTLLLSFLIACYISAFGQQYNLYNTRTLYDVFENPSQSAYQIDTSRRFAFNFFIPTISLNGTFSGDGAAAFKSLIYDGVFNGSGLDLGKGTRNNRLLLNTNNYVAMFRVLSKVKRSREIGFSWQLRNDLRLRATNETFALFDDFDLFTEASYNDIVNDYLLNQSYHQFSMTYRESITKRLSLGIKASLLSGITYSELRVRSSELNILPNDEIEVLLAGRYRSNFLLDKFETSMIMPFFKNPGLSITAGAGYKFKHGWSAFGNIKDLGMIKWSKSSYEHGFNTGKIVIDSASNSSSDNRLADSLEQRINTTRTNRSFVSAINSKLEIILNKDFGNYQPNLIISKTLFNPAGDFALINNYRVKNYVFSVSTSYNTSKLLQIGGQFMIKTPNKEFFLGSDQLFKTIRFVEDFRENSKAYSAGYTGASVYFGAGFKFGRVLEHPTNANYIPGLEETNGPGFMKRIFRRKAIKAER
jgi:hypothetical protein